MTVPHPTTAPDTAVRVDDATRSFAGRTVLSVDQLTIPRGQVVVLIGHSGSGKSTLLRALAGLDDEATATGSISVPFNRSLLFQDSRLLPWMDLISNVTLGFDDASASGKGQEVLADVGLAGRENDMPLTLSGGERQRVALARALVRDPELLLADEPFGALDALTRIRMHGLLRRLIDEFRPTVVLVTHDVDEAIALGDRIIALDGGRVIYDRDIDVLRDGTVAGPDNPDTSANTDDLAQRTASLRAELLTVLGVTQI